MSVKADGAGGARVTVVAKVSCERAATLTANRRCYIRGFIGGLESGEEFGKGHSEAIGTLLEGRKLWVVESALSPGVRAPVHPDVIGKCLLSPSPFFPKRLLVKRQFSQQFSVFVQIGCFRSCLEHHCSITSAKEFPRFQKKDKKVSPAVVAYIPLRVQPLSCKIKL